MATDFPARKKYLPVSMFRGACNMFGGAPCANFPDLSGHNQLTNTKFTRHITQIFKSTTSEWRSGDAFGRHAVPWKWTAPPPPPPPFLSRTRSCYLASLAFSRSSFEPNLCCLFRAGEIHLRWCYQICMPCPTGHRNTQAAEHLSTVLPGYCDTYGEWQKCHNNRLSHSPVISY